jgi:hypothetical protein
VWFAQKLFLQKAYIYWCTQGEGKKQKEFIKEFCVEFSSQERPTLAFSRIINFDNFYVKHHH